MTRTALVHFIFVVVRRHPEMMDEWVGSMEGADALGNVMRLRDKQDHAAARRELGRALSWAKHVRMVWLAEVGAGRVKRWRKG